MTDQIDSTLKGYQPMEIIERFISFIAILKIGLTIQITRKSWNRQISLFEINEKIKRLTDKRIQ